MRGQVGVLASFLEVFRQLFSNRTAFEQENQTEQQRKDFQEQPDHAAAGMVLAGGEVIRAKRECAE